VEGVAVAVASVGFRQRPPISSSSAVEQASRRCMCSEGSFDLIAGRGDWSARIWRGAGRCSAELSAMDTQVVLLVLRRLWRCLQIVF